MQIASLNQSDKVDLLGDLIPEFKSSLEMARMTQLKYNVLTNRLGGGTAESSRVAQYAYEIKEVLKEDEFVNFL